jgi:hypothetical protein
VKLDSAEAGWGGPHIATSQNEFFASGETIEIPPHSAMVLDRWTDEIVVENYEG